MDCLGALLAFTSDKTNKLCPQLLESSKLRLEMLLEQQRKEARLEAAARDDEMEETRANAAKKLKSEFSICFIYATYSLFSGTTS